MIIEQPHGYLIDGYGRVVLKFANWTTGKHSIPDSVEVVEYVDGPNSHDKNVHEDYQPDTL